MNEVLEFLKSLMKKRLLLLISLGTTTVVLSVIFIPLVIKSFTKPKKLADSVVMSAQELSVIVPEGAYNKTKTFEIRRISPSEIHTSLSTVFVSNLYSVVPSDGINEFAMTPITIRYRLPANLYLGDEYANVSIAYVPNTKEPIYRFYGGAYIQTDLSGAYLEAQVFHTSAIGLVAHVPEKQKLGLQLMKENTKSVEPVILLIPDVDRNFLGSVATSRQQVNFWAELFPNRTIMYFEYPIAGTKSKAYMDGYTQFSRTNGVSSYLFYEASKLAAELIRLSNLEFDIVAHGIGGIIARLAVEKYTQVKNVRKIVLVSTPCGGTNVVNPIYFGSFFYEKPGEVVARNFGTEKSIVDAARTHVLFYLESLGPIYREILPGGTAVKLLGNPRADIDYLTVTGDRPPMSISLAGTMLEKFYPELAYGDGVVSSDSAQFKGAEHFTAPGSFFDCYLSTEFQNKLKDFLRYEPPKVPEYQRDNYPERVPLAQVTEKLTVTPSTHTQRTRQNVTVPSSFKVASIATIKERISASDILNLYMIGSVLVYHHKDGLYVGQNRVFSGEIKYAHIVAGKLGVLSGSKAILYDGKNIKDMGTVLMPENCLDMLISEFGIYALTKTSKINLLRWSNQWEIIGQFDGEYARFADVDKPCFFTNSEVYKITDQAAELLVRSSDLSLKGRSLDLTSFYELENLIILGTRAYSLILYDKTNKSHQIIAEGWINPGQIVANDNWVVVFGGSSLMFFDLKNLRFRSEIQKLDGQVRGAALMGGSLYVLVDNRLDVLNLP